MQKILGNRILLSQSRLKNLLGNNPTSFYADKPKKEIYAFTKGDYFEDLLLDPLKVFKKYVIMDFKVENTNKFHKIINTFFLEREQLISIDMKDYSDDLLKLMDKFEYYESSDDEKRLVKIREVAGSYWNKYIKYRDARKSGKMVLDTESSNNIKEIVAGIISHEIFKTYLPPYKKKVQYETQKKITFEYLGDNCIAILDLVKINHENKTIEIVDIKFSSLNDSRKAALTARWDIQGAFYYWAAMSEYTDLIKDGYTLCNPLFLVGRAKTPKQPVLYEMSSMDIVTGHTGCTKYSNKEVRDPKDGIVNYSRPYVIEGFHQLIERYQWHKKTNKWEFRKEFYDNMGLEELNLF